MTRNDRPSTPAHERRLPREVQGRIWRPIPNPRLTIRCDGRRLLRVGPGEPAPLGGTFQSLWVYLEGDRLVERDGPPSGPMVTYNEILLLRLNCHNHPRGHYVDGRRLRAVVNRGAAHAKIREIEPL